MMTEEQRQQFAWLTARAGELAPLLTTKTGAPLGARLLSIVHREFARAFPEEEQRHVAAEAAVEASRQRRMERMAAEGPKLWEELHRRAVRPSIDPVEESAFLNGLAARLPCGDCRNFFSAWRQQRPADFLDYFAWTVALHNAVNAKLGKPSMTVEEALARWS